ncbi:hypothetical protein OFM39_25360, partial [Escherichia coli]|nr:hypothetical protein [Escherichia coli]
KKTVKGEIPYSYVPMCTPNRPYPRVRAHLKRASSTRYKKQTKTKTKQKKKAIFFFYNHTNDLSFINHCITHLLLTLTLEIKL